MGGMIDDAALDVLFRDARTHFQWRDTPVPDELLHRIYDLMKMGPTSANCTPARIVFVKSPEAKKRLRPHLIPENVAQTMTAPVTAIIGHDLRFYDLLPRLFPHTDARSWFEGDEALIEETARRNGSLQGGYFILAARALGLDCGPMSGFDEAGVNAVFFPRGRVRVNFLCNLGYGSEVDYLFERGPRLPFEEACQIL
ncbi:MAG: malonic semialdehyde reductase [Alphaproteobacteria bacterium]